MPTLRQISEDLVLTSRALASPIRDVAVDLEMVDGLLDGAFSKLYRDAVSVNTRKARGAFFTPSATANRLVLDIPVNKPIFDPSAGAGDLLIAHSRRLDVRPSLPDTLKAWGDVLRGTELQPALVHVAKTRLVLAALRRGSRPCKGNDLNPSAWFPHIRQANFLAETRLPAGANLVLNPPYGATKLQRPNEWARGCVSKAAVHLAHAVNLAEQGTEVVALLPDVLRAGSRYAALRQWLARNLDINAVEPIGAFDKHADVDVFILRGRRGDAANATHAWPPLPRASKVVGDLFKVRVGSVVPHRDAEDGVAHRYADVAAVRPWATVERLGPPRRFKATLFDPPFVVVRRTSSPSDRRRAVGSIVTGIHPVAVENHLIVAAPLDGTLSRCKALLTSLNRDETDAWINSRIRCRHLPVGVVRAIPVEVTK